jgi:hypothetical protein
MTEALFGFLGVLIGVVATVVLDAQRAKREKVAQRAQDQRELRRAARLILHELDEDRDVLRDMIEKPDLWEDAQRSLPMVVWDTWRAPLAALLADDHAWDKIADAYLAISAVNWTIIGRKKTGVALELRSERNRKVVGDADSLTADAMEILSGLLGSEFQLHRASSG